MEESYHSIVEKQVEAIIQYIKMTPLPDNPCVILDVDETVVRNVETVRGERDPSAPAPPIEAMRPLEQALRERGVAYAFVTSRTHEHDGLTKRDVEAAGFGNHVGIYLSMKPMESADEAARFKRHCRSVVAKKYSIVATIGDQLTDVTGEPLGQPFLLYNPYYTIDGETGQEIERWKFRNIQ
jgi:predicted HAD superfamily phosphohydrolase YqeG